MAKVLKIVDNVDMVYLCISQYIHGDMIYFRITVFESIKKGTGITPSLLPLFLKKMTSSFTSHIKQNNLNKIIYLQL